MNKNTSGVWICEKLDGNVVTIVKLIDFITDDENAMRGEFNITRGIGVGKDKINFTPGSIIEIADNGPGLNIYNVTAGDGPSQLQYEFALWKLGLGVKPPGYIPSSTIDAQFKSALTKRNIN